MAISDYFNVFGVENPAYSGLLGPEQSAGLRKSSNIAGLLGAASALAAGTSGQGPRRSALQNIIGALAGGYGAAGQQYQQGLQNYGQTQQLALQQRQQAGVQAMKMKYPDLADEFDTNPAGAFRIVSEREAALRKPTTVGEGQTLVDPTGKVLFQSPLGRKKNTAVVGNVLIDLDTGQPIYQGQQDRKTAVVNGQVVDTSTGEVIFGQPTGDRTSEIKNYEYYKSTVPAGQKVKTFDQWSESANKGTTVNVMPSDKKFGEGLGTATAAAVENTLNKARSAQNTLSTIETIKPLIKGEVFAGPLSESEATISRLGAKFGITSGSTQEKLNATAQAMQGLAQLELQAADAMKGQGTITDFERALIGRAAGGDLAKLTQKEVLGLLGALEKVSKRTISRHTSVLNNLRKRPDTANLADFFELDTPQPKLKFNPATGKVE